MGVFLGEKVLRLYHKAKLFSYLLGLINSLIKQEMDLLVRLYVKD